MVSGLASTSPPVYIPPHCRASRRSPAPEAEGLDETAAPRVSGLDVGNLNAQSMLGLAGLGLEEAPAVEAPPQAPTHVSVMRSAQGEGGVSILRRGADVTVAKTGEYMAYDWVASHIAEAMGCQVAGNLTFGAASDEDAARLHVPVGQPLLKMNFIAGRTLMELSLSDRRALTLEDADAGEHLYRQLGRAVALDLLTGNIDRFPGIGLESNPGNLMIEDDKMYCMDNSLARFCGDNADLEVKRRRIAEEMATLLKLAVDPDDDVAAGQLQIALGLLHTIRLSQPPSWHQVGAFVVQGFRDGVAASRAVTAPWVESLLARGVANDRVSLRDGESLLLNLRQFHAAQQAMTAGR